MYNIKYIPTNNKKNWSLKEQKLQKAQTAHQQRLMPEEWALIFQEAKGKRPWTYIKLNNYFKEKFLK